MIKRIIILYRHFLILLTSYSSWKNPFSPVFLTWYFSRKRIERARPFFRGIVIDNGCGKKPYREVVNQTSRYIGFDYPQLVFDNKNIRRELQPDIYGDGFALPFRAESIDCILNTQVMEYVSEPDCFIQEISRVLKRSGTIVMILPFTYPVHHLTHDFYRYTDSGISYLLKKNGFQIVWIKANGGFWITIGQLFLYFLNFKFLFRSKHDFLWLLFGGIRLLLTPVILLFNCIFNVLALLLDRIHPEPYITLNYSLVAQKSER